jgi:uncharacterized protein YqeY
MDNLINDKIDMLIMSSMKNHAAVRTETLRAIKTAFLNWKTAKENVGKTIDEGVEIQILNKMVKQRQESVEQFLQAGRTELANAELAQINIIKEFLPTEATEDEVLAVFNNLVQKDGVEPVKKNMGVFIKGIKALLPNADGKMVAGIVQKNLQ